MLLVAYLYFILWFPMLRAQSAAAQFSARSLDSLLQDYAYRAFLRRPRTGVPYDGNVPSNLTGIKVAALRLRSGSLRRKGVYNYKEFHIPIGVVEHPYVERLVLVYHNLANWSSLYYPLPGYTYLAPVLGLLAYDAFNLSAKNLQELDIRASQDPITIHLVDVQEPPKGTLPMCVYFGLDGSVAFDNVINRSVCSATKQGHFSIAVQYSAPAPSPVGTGGEGRRGSSGGGRRRKLWIILGSVIGGLLLLVLLGTIFVCLKKCRDKKKIQRMEAAADTGENLLVANVGYTRAPVASEIRTRPVLENEYMP